MESFVFTAQLPDSPARCARCTLSWNENYWGTWVSIFQTKLLRYSVISTTAGNYIMGRHVDGTPRKYSPRQPLASTTRENPNGREISTNHPNLYLVIRLNLLAIHTEITQPEHKIYCQITLRSFKQHVWFSQFSTSGNCRNESVWLCFKIMPYNCSQQYPKFNNPTVAVWRACEFLLFRQCSACVFFFRR